MKEVVVQNNYRNTVHALDMFGSTGMYGDGLFGGGIGNSGGGGYSWDAGGGGSGINAPAPVQIIDALTGKAKCINDLLNKSGNFFVQKLLANFSGKSEFNVRIASTDKVISRETKLEINGETYYSGTGDLIDIRISTSRIDRIAGLEGARIILHEYVHADMYRKLFTSKEKDEVDVQDFKKVFELYERNHHSSMAALYINSMRDALKEFHKNVLTDDYNKFVNYYGVPPTDSFYEAMAWGGLKDNKVKAWSDLPADKKASIEELYNRVSVLSKMVPCP